MSSCRLPIPPFYPPLDVSSGPSRFSPQSSVPEPSDAKRDLQRDLFAYQPPEQVTSGPGRVSEAAQAPDEAQVQSGASEGSGGQREPGPRRNDDRRRWQSPDSRRGISYQPNDGSKSSSTTANVVARVGGYLLANQERLTAEEEARLVAQAKAGDRAAFDRLVESLMPMVLRMVERRHSSNQELEVEDLIEAATNTLRRVIIRRKRPFDPTRGRLVSLVYRSVSLDLRKAVRAARWNLGRATTAGLPRSVQERYDAISRAQQRLHHRLFREPTAAEIAEEIGGTEAEVLYALEAARGDVSFDVRVSLPNGEAVPMAECLAEPDRTAEQKEHEVQASILDRAMAQLNDTQRAVLQGHIMEGQNLRMVARKLRLTLPAAQQALTTGQARLTQALAADGRRGWADMRDDEE